MSYVEQLVERTAPDWPALRRRRTMTKDFIAEVRRVGRTFSGLILAATGRDVPREPDWSWPPRKAL